MQKNKATFIVMLLVFNFFINAYPVFGISGKTKVETWEIAKQGDGITLSYRWILEENKLKAREMKAEFTIDAEISGILLQFKSAGNYLKWAAGIKECEIKKITDETWFSYTLMNYPWPFKQKDLVTKHSIRENAHGTELQITADSCFFPIKEGIERMNDYKGTWLFSSLPNGSTFVEYHVISSTKPIIPRIIQDPIIQKLCLDSFKKLKQLSENQ